MGEHQKVFMLYFTDLRRCAGFFCLSNAGADNAMNILGN